jgi:hypothetical protein
MDLKAKFLAEQAKKEATAGVETLEMMMILLLS